MILVTGKLDGKEFDHPVLDTLVLAMPVSRNGTLQQYAGRLHREHADKAYVCIIDFMDSGHSALLRMWSKRQAGYKAMGYEFADSSSSMELLSQESPAGSLQKTVCYVSLLTYRLRPLQRHLRAGDKCFPATAIANGLHDLVLFAASGIVLRALI